MKNSWISRIWRCLLDEKKKMGTDKRLKGGSFKLKKEREGKRSIMSIIITSKNCYR